MIMMSAYVGTGQLAVNGTFEIDVFIEKPFSMILLSSQVRHLFAGSKAKVDMTAN